MSFLEQLGLMLGLAAFAGFNLYLTIFLTGLALRFNAFQIAHQYQVLEVFAHPLILIVTGVMFLLEFVLDKIPWIDTLWDTVHTFIRPLGGALIGYLAYHESPLYLMAVMILLAGFTALTTHSFKATSRLLLNQSPALLPNILFSLLEDALVIGGIILTLLQPVTSLTTCILLLIFGCLLYPRTLRAARSTWKFAWHKLQMPPRQNIDAISVKVLPKHLDSTLKDILLYKGGLSEKDIAANVPCLSGPSRGIKGLTANLEGQLILTEDMQHLYFSAIKDFRNRLFRIPIRDHQFNATLESAFLSENVIITTDQTRFTLRFPRDEHPMAEQLVSHLQSHNASFKQTHPDNSDTEIQETTSQSPKVPQTANIPVTDFPDQAAPHHLKPKEQQQHLS